MGTPHETSMLALPLTHPLDARHAEEHGPEQQYAQGVSRLHCAGQVAQDGGQVEAAPGVGHASCRAEAKGKGRDECSIQGGEDGPLASLSSLVTCASSTEMTCTLVSQ